MAAQDPSTQLTYWNEAVQLLGGQRPAARTLGCNERTIRALCSGERNLHDGWLKDISSALLQHASACRNLERKLSPDFSGNLTADQAKGKDHNWRRDHIPKEEASLIRLMQIDHFQKMEAHWEGARWKIGRSFWARLCAEAAQVQSVKVTNRSVLGLPYEIVEDDMVDHRKGFLLEEAV
ncbi:hypothetical protein HT136_01245 [Novosphingobium profundi]|uniref:hypothetical protein n=1 Tax=Novosphingobium profundi TaxID=1774954 RepID=UPI001BD9ADD4|nr:hypothetical protein [Novosphingobium profundi]MBT0666991.1 hypothetical protein [Novosphingobium profundi]